MVVKKESQRKATDSGRKLMLNQSERDIISEVRMYKRIEGTKKENKR